MCTIIRNKNRNVFCFINEMRELAQRDMCTDYFDHKGYKAIGQRGDMLEEEVFAMSNTNKGPIDFIVTSGGHCHKLRSVTDYQYSHGNHGDMC